MPAAAKNKINLALVGIALLLVTGLPAAIGSPQISAHPCCPTSAPAQQHNSAGPCGMCRALPRVPSSLPSLRYQQQFPLSVEAASPYLLARPLPVAFDKPGRLLEARFITHHQLLI